MVGQPTGEPLQGSEEGGLRHVFGFDRDGPDVFSSTLKWLVEQKVETMTAHILTPYPGTRFYTRLEREHRIIDSDLRHYNTSRVVFQPKQMTPKELYEGTKKVIKEYNTVGKMLKRWIRLPKLSLTTSTITTMIGMDFSRKIWYKREYGI